MIPSLQIPRFRHQALLGLLILLAGPVALAQLPPSADWRDQAAQAVAFEARVGERLGELQRAVTAGNEEQILELLRGTVSDPAWPPAAREKLLYGFTEQLRSQPPRAVGTAVMGFLNEYQPSVLVPHEDHPRAGVPLFNIRAAAAGIENGWRRQEAAYAGAVLLAADPGGLVQAYRLHDDPPVRQGLLDALDNASAGQLEAIAFMALEYVGQEPVLTALAGRAALYSGDSRALEQLLRTGSGAAITHVLRQARAVLSTEQLGRLLRVATEEAQPVIASVAIAELAPALSGREDARALLLGYLGDPQLGSSAALALAAQPSDRNVSGLLEVTRAAPGTLAASRARLALDVMQVGVPERDLR